MEDLTKKIKRLKALCVALPIAASIVSFIVGRKTVKPVEKVATEKE